MHEGHRGRLYNKLINDEKLSQVELTEILLFSSIPRRDVRPIAEDLIARFQTLEGVIAADPNALLEIKGIGASTVAMIKMITMIAEHLISSRIIPTHRLRSIEDCIIYFKRLFNGSTVEKLYIVLLNADYELVAQTCFTDSNESETTATTNELNKFLLENPAKFAILSHNHFNNPTPSDADDMSTKRMIFTLETYNITLIDHIIISHSGHYSFKYSGRLQLLHDELAKDMYREKF